MKWDAWYAWKSTILCISRCSWWKKSGFPVAVGRLSHYLQRFIHPRWCRISSIKSILFIPRNFHSFYNWSVFCIFASTCESQVTNVCLQKDGGLFLVHNFSRWWLNHPFEKYSSKIWQSFPTFVGWKFRKICETTTYIVLYINSYGIGLMILSPCYMETIWINGSWSTTTIYHRPTPTPWNQDRFPQLFYRGLQCPHALPAVVQKQQGFGPEKLVV